ncbi:MAG: hypothetical protein IIY55_05395, partial [Blautia sp.]|nr:hypothetical protein [Blautia sp.]
MELLHPLLLVLCGLLCLGRISAPSDIPAGESRLETAQMPGLTEDGKESAGNADQTGSEERTAGNASDAIEISGGLELPEITIFRADDEAAEGDAAEGT